MPELGGGPGGPLAPPLQYLADQLTLFEPGRADYPHLLQMVPPMFFTFRHHWIVGVQSAPLVHIGLTNPLKPGWAIVYSAHPSPTSSNHVIIDHQGWRKILFITQGWDNMITFKCSVRRSENKRKGREGIKRMASVLIIKRQVIRFLEWHPKWDTFRWSFTKYFYKTR